MTFLKIPLIPAKAGTSSLGALTERSDQRFLSLPPVLRDSTGSPLSRG